MSKEKLNFADMSLREAGLSEEQIKRAKQWGYSGLFGHRDSVQEAINEMFDACKAISDDGERVRAVTSFGVLINSYAVYAAKHLTEE